MSNRRSTRRRYLLTAGVVATAGCLQLSDGDDGASNEDPTPETDDETTESPAPTPTTTTNTTREPTGTTEAPADGPYDGWFAETDNFEGTADVVGNETLTVLVGAEGNDGQLAFSPPAIRISRGATVVWEWTGGGGQHNVRVEQRPADATWDGYPSLRNESGFTYEYTFDVPGTYLYYCAPHKPQGMNGVVVVDGDSSVGGDDGGETDRLSFGGDGRVDVGISPSVPQEDLEVQYEPLMDHLERYLSENYDVPAGLAVEDRVGSDYATVIRALGDGRLDVAETGPFAAAVGVERGDAEILLQRFGYGAWEYASLVAVRTDSDVTDLSDLSGKTVVFTDRLSSSGALFPLYSMSQAGLDVGDLPTGNGRDAEFEALFAGGHVAAYTVLAEGQADAAAMGGFVRDTPAGPSTDEWTDTATAIHEDAGIPRAPIVASPELGDRARDAVQQAFLDAPSEAYWGEDGDDGTSDDLWFDRVRAADADTYRAVVDAVEELDIGLEVFER